MPDAPTPRAPLLTEGMTDEILGEYLEYAREPETPLQSTAVIISLNWELDAQRAARATAYAEGRREALEDVFTTVATQSTAGMTALDALSWVLSVIAARVDALRDTPAPPSREEP